MTGDWHGARLAGKLAAPAGTRRPAYVANGVPAYVANGVPASVANGVVLCAAPGCPPP